MDTIKEVWDIWRELLQTMFTPPWKPLQSQQERKEKQPMSLKLSSEVTTVKQVHPALDIVDDILYVGVRVKDDDNGLIDAVLTDKGDNFTPEEWETHWKATGLSPSADIDLGHSSPVSRWNNQSIQALIDGTLTAPTFKEAYDAITAALGARLEVHRESYIPTLALWSMMTYFQPLWDALPILHGYGPAESGKSRALAAVAYLSFNGTISDPTRAVVFRRAHQGRYTQVITEGDGFALKGTDDDFVRQLQASHTKTEGFVTVTEKTRRTEHEPTTFHSFSPRAIGSTKEFKSHPLRTRCIRLTFRKMPHANEQKLRKSLADDTVWEDLRDKLYRLLFLKWHEVRNAREQVKRECHTVKGRAFDKWLPLLTMARLVSPELYQQVTAWAQDDMQAMQEDTVDTFHAALMLFSTCFIESRSDESEDGKIVTDRASIYDLWQMPAITNDFKPLWATMMGATVTLEQVRRWVKGPRKLMEELTSLGLVERLPHTDKGTPYRFDKEAVLGVARAYLGENFDKELTSNKPQPIQAPPTPPPVRTPAPVATGAQWKPDDDDEEYPF